VLLSRAEGSRRTATSCETVTAVVRTCDECYWPMTRDTRGQFASRKRLSTQVLDHETDRRRTSVRSVLAAIGIASHRDAARKLVSPSGHTVSGFRMRESRGLGAGNSQAASRNCRRIQPFPARIPSAAISTRAEALEVR